MARRRQEQTAEDGSPSSPFLAEVALRRTFGIQAASDLQAWACRAVRRKPTSSMWEVDVGCGDCSCSEDEG